MNKLIEMYDKRAKAWEATKAFLDTKTDANGKVSAEDAATYDKMEADVVALTKNIERLEKQRAIDDEFSKPTSKPITNTPAVPAIDEKTGRASNEYRQNFWNAMRNKPFVSNIMTESIDADGGFYVPEEFDKTLIRALEESNIMRGLGKIITTGGERKINVAAGDPSAAWTDEGGAVTFTDAHFGQISIDAYKLTIGLKASDELLADSVFNLESYIAEEFARAIGNAEEEAFITGNGTKKPVGILNTTSGGTVGKTTTNATAITTDEVLDLIYSLKSPYRKRASFLVNEATIADIRKLKDGNGQYLWQPSLTLGEPDKLFGYALNTSAFVPTKAAGAVTMAFGDFSYYWIADRGGRTFKRLNELFAGNGLVGFIATQRVDGKVVLREAIKLLQMKSA